MEFLLLILGVGALAGLFSGGSDTDDVGNGPVEPEERTDNPGQSITLGDNNGTFTSTGAGDDDVFGGSGFNTIETNAGDDFIFGAAGSDTISAGSGNDLVSGGAGHDTINLNGGSDIYVPSEYFDELAPQYDEPNVDANWTGGHDVVQGGWGNDIIWDDRGQNQLYGGAGDDLLVAFEGVGSDLGNDQLFGGKGNDTLVGDLGDELTGGQGIDRFFVDIVDFNPTTVLIHDFDPNQETVVLDVIAADPAGPNGLPSSSYDLDITTQENGSDTLVFMGNSHVATLLNATGVDANSITVQLRTY